jgi:hypothetical protein
LRAPIASLVPRERPRPHAQTRAQPRTKITGGGPHGDGSLGHGKNGWFRAALGWRVHGQARHLTSQSQGLRATTSSSGRRGVEDCAARHARNSVEEGADTSSTPVSVTGRNGKCARDASGRLPRGPYCRRAREDELGWRKVFSPGGPKW